MYVANVGSQRGAGNGNRVDQKEAAGFNSAQRPTDAGNRKIGSQGSRIGSTNQEGIEIIVEGDTAVAQLY